ncbi:MAG TPA: hypothetical protein VH277_05435 [Gemmatimonadaceae bacterium]|jgi:hypothetical protein|nr:hypothetical protein [Gemmatimonadaceae bacterium]
MAVWLAFSLSEPAILHSCPVHSGHASSHGMHAMHAMNATHGESTHGMREHGSSTQNDQSGGHACTCTSSCCCTPPVGLAAGSVSLALAEPAPAHDAGIAEYSHIPAAAAHVLPFAIGPPVIV